MHKMPVDEDLRAKLTKKYDYESSISQPGTKQLNLSGPRMGFLYVFGEEGTTLKKLKSEGGFDMNPFMFQLGYQFEKQYLQGGVYQALFEFIGVVTGIDQSKFIPSVAIINGLRNNKNGWEFGIGGDFGLSTMATVYKAPDEKFYPVNEWSPNTKPGGQEIEPKDTYEKLDSRGSTRFTTAAIIAVGKSFRSGDLNIPVNLWVMPEKNAFRAGISVGFNSVK